MLKFEDMAGLMEFKALLKAINNEKKGCAQADSVTPHNDGLPAQEASWAGVVAERLWHRYEVGLGRPLAA